MKMKRAKIEITMEYPANRNWEDYISVSGGQTVNAKTKVVEDVDLGDIDPPWGQNMREMYTVRKIIADGLKASLPNMPDLIINVTGSKAWSNIGGFVYYASFTLKKYENSPKYPAQVLAISGLTWTLEPGGALVWERNRGGDPKKLTTMQVGNPDIVNEIRDYLLKLYQK